MHILIIYDGKPGHLSQSQGLANLIASRSSQNVTIEILKAKPAIKLLNRLLRKLCVMKGTAYSWMVQQLYRTDIPKKRPELIISFGGNVAALNVALRHFWQVNNIIIGNRYSISPNYFDAQITMFGDRNHSSNIASFVALSGMSASECATAGIEYRNKYPHSRYWSMLIGGNGGGYEYSDNEFHQLGRAMAELSYRYDFKWLVTTSRRTNTVAEILLRQYLTHETATEVCFYNSGENSCIKSVLGASERIFCTEDSLSMISEAASLEKPVVTVKPKTVPGNGVHRQTIDRMSSIDLISTIPIEQLGHYQPSMYNPTKSYESHLDDVYDQVKRLVVTARHVRTSAFIDKEVTT